MGVANGSGDVDRDCGVEIVDVPDDLVLVMLSQLKKMKNKSHKKIMATATITMQARPRP